MLFSEIKQVNFPKREILGEEFTDEDYEKLCTKLLLQNEQVNQKYFNYDIIFLFSLRNIKLEILKVKLKG